MLVSTSRCISASRSASEIIGLATSSLCKLTGATRAQFVDATMALATMPIHVSAPHALSHDVYGHGRMLGRFELIFAPGDTPLIDAALVDAAVAETVELLATVTGTALARVDAAVESPTPADDRRDLPRGDRRKMDRDFIDHTRNGQVGFIVLRIAVSDLSEVEAESTLLSAAAVVDGVVRQNDLTYLSGPGELSILLPGASKPEAAMAADRIRTALIEAWHPSRLGPQTAGTEPSRRLAGGVTSGRFEDPQRLAERAFDALDEALDMEGNAIVTALGS